MSDIYLDDMLGTGGWTSSKHAKRGDTLFFYFIAPYQAIHFVARASCDAFFDEEFQRWRICFESMVRIKPIHLSRIRDLFDEKRLLLFVRDGKWIRPDLANRLLCHIVDEYCAEWGHVDKVRQRVLGRLELGQPNGLTLDKLKEIESSDFNSEEEVEYHLLEPLFRIAGIHGQAKIVRKWDLPNNKTADYAMLDCRQKVLCIIEAKLNLGRRSNWARNPHVKQAREYAEMCNAPGFVVMDRDRFVCFPTQDENPCLVLNRTTLDENGLSALRAYILNQKTARPIVRQDPRIPKMKQRRRGRDA